MRGQYFSFDAIIASVIFIMALVALLSYWHSVKSYLDYQNDQLSREAVRISNLLFTPPAPSSDCNSITMLGLSSSWEDRRINASMLTCAESKAAADTTWLQSKLNTPFQAYIMVTNLSPDSGHTVADIGNPPPLDAVEVAKMRRLATVVNADGTTYAAAVDLAMYKIK